MISLKDYLTASGSYPEREKHPELTPELIANAQKLLKCVNSLLKELGIGKVRVSSGFRPSAVNAKTKGAAKKSNHMLCLAVDILDDGDQSIAKACTPALLEKHGLYREDYEYTRGKYTNWCHLQCIAPKSGNRIFKP